MIIQFRALRSTALLTGLVLAVGGCLGSESLKKKSTDANLVSDPDASKTLTYGAGPRAAKIIFRATDFNASGSYGSFDQADVPPSTPNSFGDGVPVARYYAMDDTPLAEIVTFIKRAEVRISGAQNAKARRSYCARFTPSDATGYNCNPDNISNLSSPCLGPAGYYAVSELQCAGIENNIQRGQGRGTDGVGFFVEFDRDKMESFENIKVTLQYNAAAPTAAENSLNPTYCFAGIGESADPTNPSCSPLSWGVSMAASPTESSSLLMHLLPATPATVVNHLIRTNFQTREIIVPLAAHPDVKYLFITRTDANQQMAAGCAVTPANTTYGDLSPLCHGMVLMTAIIERF